MKVNNFLFVIFIVGTYKLVGKQTVADALDAALTAGYHLIGEWAGNVHCVHRCIVAKADLVLSSIYMDIVCNL